MATYTIKDTSLNVFQFASANVKAPLLSVLPYVVVCQLAQILTAQSYPIISLVMLIVNGYFYCLFATHMHRAYLVEGHSSPFNPLRSTKDDWRFIGMIAFLFFVLTLLAAVVIFVFNAAMGKAGIFVAVLILIPTMLILGIRVSVILPDRAIGGHMKIPDAFRLSHGLAWKMLLSPLRAGWKLLVAVFVWVFIMTVISETIIKMGFPEIQDRKNTIHQLVSFVVQAPATIGLGYWLAAMGIATLSNYYQWIKENRAT